MSEMLQTLNTQVPTASGEQTEGDHQFLTFMLGGEMFGIDILPIKEIIEYAKVTTVPTVPEYIRGVINLRGHVTPVIDLSVRFGWQPKSITKRSCIVIIEMVSEEDTNIFGVVVDSVNEVIDMPATNIEPPPNFGAKIRTDFISGMGKVNDDFIVLLDTNKVLSVNELSTLSDLARSA